MQKVQIYFWVTFYTDDILFHIEKSWNTVDSSWSLTSADGENIPITTQIVFLCLIFLWKSNRKNILMPVWKWSFVTGVNWNQK